MSDKRPDPRSKRTHNRALALAWARGCDELNLCWDDCLEAALDTIVDGELDDWERTVATTSQHWRYTNPP